MKLTLKRLVIAGAVVLIVFGIACMMGMKSKAVDVTAEYGGKVVSLLGHEVEYVGISEDETALRNLIYSDGIYDYYVDPAQEYISRIVLRNSNAEGYFIDDMEYESELLCNRYMPESEDRTLKCESNYTEGVGYDVLFKGYQEENFTGDEALINYDEKKQLIIAVFMPNLNENPLPEEKITEGQASELAMEQAEYNTLNGLIDGSKEAIAVKYSKVLGAEKKYSKDKWFWVVELDAQVEFSTRGWIHKYYTVTVDMETGEVTDTAWSLE
ncbi:MAG: hypothetical protein PUB22_05920 [Clostridiales bacterium]|nr:hypothetical protein [Clostridiales bacterium]